MSQAETITTPIAQPIRAVVTGAPSAEKPPRMIGIDAGRVIAALAVVWLHTTVSYESDGHGALSLWCGESLGRFGMRFFSFITIILIGVIVQRDSARTIAAYALRRCQRIYIPFLIWSAIYYALSILKRLYFHQDFIPPDWSMLLTGKMYHLWFLPFALFSGTFAFVLLKGIIVLKSTMLRITTGILCILGGLALALLYPMPYATHTPTDAQSTLQGFTYWWHHVAGTLPAMLWALGSVTLWPKLKLVIHQSTQLVWISLAAWLLVTCLVQFVGRYSILVNLAAVSFGLAALGNWRIPPIAALATFGRHAFGIYLIHPVFLLVASHLIFHSKPIPNFPTAFAVFVIAAAGSLTAAMMINRSKYTSWIIAN